MFIRVDANSQIGIGHFMRCFALAQQSRKQGWKVTFISDNESKLLISSIKEEGFQFVFIEKSYPNPIDLETTLLTINNSSAINNMIVLDGYNFDIDYQKSIKKNGNQLLVIDDTAHQKRYVADIIINQNIIAKELTYFCQPETTFLLGTDYVLLRNEFLSYRNWKRKVPEIAKRVLVTMGGGDIDGITFKVLEAFNQVDILDLEIIVLVGANNKHINDLKQAADTKKHNIKFITNVTNIPELMAWADIAVSSAGSTCWELAFLGLPAMLIVTSLNQIKNLQFLEQVGVATYASNQLHISVDLIFEKIQQLIMDKNLRKDMRDKGKLLVDGNGSKRVINLIQKLNIKKRKTMRKKIVLSIYDSIDSLNAQNLDEQPIAKSENTVLFGSNSNLDSLGLINLIVTVEQNIEDELDTTITLADERAMSQETSPFRTVGTLTDYIEILLKEELDG